MWWRVSFANLRDVLGDETSESFARNGETMSTTEIATYAYDQIDQARAELNAVSNRPVSRHRKVIRHRHCLPRSWRLICLSQK
jgi:hypothetical protein